MSIGEQPIVPRGECEVHPQGNLPVALGCATGHCPSATLGPNKSDKVYTVIKETERPKHLPAGIVAMMNQEGFKRFSITAHTNLWKSMDAKNPARGFGVTVQKAWYWYDSWVDQVRKHCQDNASTYR